MISNLMPFFLNLLVTFASIGSWLITPLVANGLLPDWFTIPISLFSIVGLTLTMTMTLISFLNPLS